MSTLTLFKSHAPAMGYVFRNGKTIHFVDGNYPTSIQSEIDELTGECNAGHPCYYIDDGAKTIESEALDPLAGMKAALREEGRLQALAEMKRDMGETQFTGKLEGIANSDSIRGLQVSSDTQAAAMNPTAGIKVAASATAKKV